MNPWVRELPFLRLNDESSTCSAKVAPSPAPCWPILGDVSSGVLRKKLGEKVGEKVTLPRSGLLLVAIAALLGSQPVGGGWDAPAGSFVKLELALTGG